MVNEKDKKMMGLSFIENYEKMTPFNQGRISMMIQMLDKEYPDSDRGKQETTEYVEDKSFK